MPIKPVQKALWSENFYKALEDSICAIAPDNRNAYEHMADLLWPAKSERTRYARIKACLDPHQESTNFNPEELLFILQCEDQAGIEISIRFLSDRINRNVGERKVPKSPKAQLLERQAEMLTEAARLQHDIDRVDAAIFLKAVK